MEEDRKELINLSKFYESLRANDYSVVNGLGEVIDNSVESRASKIHVYINTEKKPGEKKETISDLVVVDNGCGMDKEVIGKCLVLGESGRKYESGQRGIGKYGVGLVTGGISLARKIEVYSRSEAEGHFLYTYIDLDDIADSSMRYLPKIQNRDPAEKYCKLLEKSSGTAIIISNCDRVQITTRKRDLSEFFSEVSYYIGRTYRKFIGGGVEMYLNDKKVFLHDPLYLAGPTRFDSAERQDPRAKVKGQKTLDYPIPGKDGETAPIRITVSLLPQEWRQHPGDGGKPEAKQRKINENEGISILRADREVLYGTVPYLIGSKGLGQAKYEKSDRFWGCEISFPPELDECFQVRYIKRGAEPIGTLKDKLRDEISPAIKELRKQIKEDWEKIQAVENKNAGVYDNVEKAMANASKNMPGSQKGRELSPEEEDKKLDKIVDEILSSDGENALEQEKKREKKEELRQKPYSIELMSAPMPTLFEPEYMIDKINIKLNVNHPFYIYVIKPLCNTVEDENDTEVINRDSKLKDAIVMIFMSYCKSESMFNDNEDMFMMLRSQWATYLSSVVKEAYERG